MILTTHVTRTAKSGDQAMISTFVELTCQLADLMVRRLTDPDLGPKRGELYDPVSKGCQRGGLIICGLGIFAATGHRSYRIVVPPDRVRAHLIQHSDKAALLHNRLIESFLELNGDLYSDLGTGRGIFAVRSSLPPARWELVAQGYASRQGNGFQWTPFMRAVGLRNADNHSHAELDRRAAEEFAKTLWRAIPFWHKHLLAGWIGEKSELQLFACLPRRCDGTRFRMFEHGPTTRAPLESLTKCERVTGVAAHRLLALYKRHPF